MSSILDVPPELLGRMFVNGDLEQQDIAALQQTCRTLRHVGARIGVRWRSVRWVPSAPVGAAAILPQVRRAIVAEIPAAHAPQLYNVTDVELVRNAITRRFSGLLQMRTLTAAYRTLSRDVGMYAPCLTTLTLRYCKVSGWPAFFSACPQLHTLNLASMTIQPSALAMAPKLRHLTVSACVVASPFPFAKHCPELETFTWIIQQEFIVPDPFLDTSLGQPTRRHGLDVIILGGQPISMTGVAEIPNLRSFTATGIELQHVRSLAGCASLSALYLYNVLMHVIDMAYVFEHGVPNIERVGIQSMIFVLDNPLHITQLCDRLSERTSLREVSFRENNLNDLHLLPMPNVEILTLRNCIGVTDLHWLTDWVGLRTLDLSDSDARLHTLPYLPTVTHLFAFGLKMPPTELLLERLPNITFIGACRLLPMVPGFTAEVGLCCDIDDDIIHQHYVFSSGSSDVSDEYVTDSESSLSLPDDSESE